MDTDTTTMPTELSEEELTDQQRFVLDSFEEAESLAIHIYHMLVEDNLSPAEIAGEIFQFGFQCGVTVGHTTGHMCAEEQQTDEYVPSGYL